MITDLLDLMGGFGTPGLCLLVALLAFSETAVFLDIVVPGEVGMVLAGAAAAQADADLVPVVAAAAVGATLGDCVSYTIGRRWGRAVVERFRFTRQRLTPALDRAERYFARRGGGAVFVGRWVGALRAVVPLVAGIGQLRFPTFLAWNALASVLWAGTVLTAGYVFGRTVVSFVDHAEQAIAVVLVVVAAGWLWHRRRTGTSV